MTSRGQVSSAHYLASQAGLDVLKSGGTAIDAGIAAGVALNVVLPDCCSFGGVAPIILHHAPTGQVVTLDGLGVWPELADRDYFVAQHGGVVPESHIRRAVTPGAPDAWLTALERFGTLSLAGVLGPAVGLARDGVPVATSAARSIQELVGQLGALPPTTTDVFAPGGEPLRPGQLLHQPALADVLTALINEEAAALDEGYGRGAAIRRARDLVYHGWIADELTRFHEAHGGWLRRADLARHRVEIGTPVRTNYRGYDALTCGFWCQGPVLVEALNILEGFDLDGLGHNTPAYLHTVIEALNLAFADREHLYGDPRHLDVPGEGLASKEYAAERAKLIDPGAAFGRMPPPGNPWRHQGESAPSEFAPVDVDRYLAREASFVSDTAYVAAADDHGNLFSATPSDPAISDPIVPSLGFPCSGRGCQSRLDREHPSALCPGRRPRLTPNPALVMLDGRPLLALGCPGGDVQPQAMLQAFLNMVHFDMTPQEAVEAPRAWTWNFPNSFSPHEYFPGRLDVEAPIDSETRKTLTRFGHSVHTEPEWSVNAAWVHTVVINPSSGILIGGADPRAPGAAVGW
jgi:gamma-glutamyltranspeptidase/glutathione hydrolase